MSTTAKAIRTLLPAVLIGAFWYLNKSRPPWEEAVRTIIVFAVIMVIVRMRVAKRGVRVHLVPLIVTKAVLIAVAAAIQYAIKGHVSDPALIIAIGLFVAVALSNLIGNRYFFSVDAHRAAVPGYQQPKS